MKLQAHGKSFTQVIILVLNPGVQIWHPYPMRDALVANGEQLTMPFNIPGLTWFSNQ